MLQLIPDTKALSPFSRELFTGSRCFSPIHKEHADRHAYRARGRPTVCSRCHQPRPGYGQSSPSDGSSSFFLGILVIMLYSMEGRHCPVSDGRWLVEQVRRAMASEPDQKRIGCSGPLAAPASCGRKHRGRPYFMGIRCSTT